MFRLVKMSADGSFTPTTISPKAAVKQDKSAAEALYQQLAEALQNGTGPKKIKKAYGKKDSGKDRCFTPPYATRLLFPFLPKGITIWEPAAGDGFIAWVLLEAGYKVIQTDISRGFDFLKDKPDFHFDAIITNPPYQAQLKLGFIKRCYEYGVPWAMLMQDMTHRNKLPQELFDHHGVEVISSDERIDYFMPGQGYKTGGSNFKSLWYTHKFGLGKETTVVKLNKPKNANVVINEVEQLRTRYGTKVETFQPVIQPVLF